MRFSLPTPFGAVLSKLFFSFLAFLLMDSLKGESLSLVEAREQVVKTEPPSWVHAKTINPEKKCPHNGVSGGIWYLCSDTQVHVEEETHFSHYAYRFINTKGISNHSQLSLNFDPRYQKLQIHAVTIHREGEAVDRLPDLEIKLLHQEEGLEQQLYDGSLSAHLILKDVQINDVLEYSYSIVGVNPVFDGHYTAFRNLAFGVPVDHFYQRYIWNPAVRDLSYRMLYTEEEPELLEEGEFRELVWERSEVEAFSYEPSTPDWYYARPMIQLSDFASWEDFSVWITKLFPMDQALPAEIERVCDEIKELESDSERIVAALVYVQDNIRYLGSFMGPHSHQPYPLETICERKFGDCKDKSSLLASMLRYLGYDAVVALVNTTDYQVIKSYLPSQYNFDHAIVCLRFEGENYWLDGTSSFQRGALKQLYTRPYEYGFVIDTASRELTKIEHSDPELHKMTITEDYEIPDLNGEVLLKVESVAIGREARSLRSYFSSSSNDDVKKDYADFYSSYYPKIEALEITFEDDEKLNRMVVNESYRIPDFWESSDDVEDAAYGSFVASSIRAAFGYPKSSVRKMPYAISHPKCIEQVVRIATPSDWQLNKIEESIENDFFKSEVKTEIEGRKVILNYQFRSKKNHVEPEEIESYISDCKDLNSSLFYEFSFDDSGQDGANSADENSDGSPFWAMVLILVLVVSLGLGSLISLVLYWKYDPESTEPSGDLALKGLSGWLILVVLAVVVSPFSLFIGLVSDAELYNGADLKAIYEAGGYLTIVLICLIVCSFALLFPYSILLNVLLFKKRSSFPKLYFVLLLSFFLMALVTMVSASNIDNFDSEIMTEYETDLVKEGMRLLIWGSYILVSVRVRNTFQNRRRATVFPPALPVTES